MKNIKLIVATHKVFQMPSDERLYLPIHVGAEGKNYLGYMGDNSGQNISNLNPYYSELTGLYWAWKNLDCDYLGLVHYRRYFTKKSQNFSDNIKIDDVILSQIDIEYLLDNADVIVPKKRRYHIETLYSHYAHTHDANHLDVTRTIITELYPEDVSIFDEVLRQRSGYMFNMFIMSKELVDQYCQWLFPIIDELFERLGSENMSAFDARYPGRVSERLFNVWLKKENLRLKEVPFMYMERVNLFEKGKSFLQAKFLGKKYGQSF